MYVFYFREVTNPTVDYGKYRSDEDGPRRYKLIAIKGRKMPTGAVLGDVYDCATIEALVSNGFKCIIEPHPNAKKYADGLESLPSIVSFFDTDKPTMRYAPGFRGPKSIHFADQECHITAQELRDQGCNTAPSSVGSSLPASHSKFEPWKPEDGVIMGGIFDAPGTFVEVAPIPEPPAGTMLDGSVAISKEFPFPDNRQLMEEFLDRKLYIPPLNFWQKLLRAVGYIQE